MAKWLATPADAPAATQGARRSLSAVVSLGVLVAVAAVAGATAQAGLWWVPFAAGVAAGVASLSRRRVVLAVSAGAVAGWGVVLWTMALRGLPAGATARAIAAFAGLPPHAFVTVVATLLLAAVQVFTGAWLARALGHSPPTTWRWPLPRRGSGQRAGRVTGARGSR